MPNPSNNPAPYNPNAWPYVLKAISWARKYNLFVIIDLHGAPGSQNGYDNSGQRLGYPGWADNAGNVNRTLDAIGYFAHEFGGEEYVNVVTMIQLMNEVSPKHSFPEPFVLTFGLAAFWVLSLDVERDSRLLPTRIQCCSKH